MRSHAKNKRDTTEIQVFAILRAHGFDVYPLHTPCDAIVGRNGVTHLVEVKSGPKANLTDAQKAFIARWRGSTVYVLDGVDSAKKWCREVRHG